MDLGITAKHPVKASWWLLSLSPELDQEPWIKGWYLQLRDWKEQLWGMPNKTCRICGLAEEWPWLWNTSKDLLNAKLTHGNLQVIRQLLLDCKPQAWFSEVMVSWTLFLHVLDDQFNAMIVVWHNLPFFPWECRWLEISHEQDIFLKGNNCSSWLIRFHCSGGLRFLGSDVGGGWSSCYAAAGRGGAGTGEVVASKPDSSKEIKWPVV